LGHQEVAACETIEDLLDLFPCEDSRQAFGPTRTDIFYGKIERHLECDFIEEDDGIQGLISPEEHRDGVSGGGDLFIDCQVIEKRFYFDLTHLPWVGKMVEADEAAYPFDVALLSGIGIVFPSEYSADLIEEFLT